MVPAEPAPAAVDKAPLLPRIGRAGAGRSQGRSEVGQEAAAAIIVGVGKEVGDNHGLGVLVKK